MTETHRPGQTREGTVCISATFTAEPLQDALRLWLNETGIAGDVRFAPYGQVFQQLLDPSSLLAANDGGANVVLVRPEDWLPHEPGAHGTALEAATSQFLSAIRSAAPSFRAPLLAGVCPASPEALSDAARAAAIAATEGRLLGGLAGTPSVTVLRMNELAGLYPVPEVHDPYGERLGAVPYTPEFFAALGTMIVRTVHAIRSAPYKVVALDCDNTLWRGICGEDGPDGVMLDQAARAVQEFMAVQRDRGMLLVLASRNNEDDVLETFRRHPEFPLQEGHFAARRVNWRAKSSNLVELAGDLDLSLDSFIFVDDNAEECAEVEADRPEVLAVPLPPETDDVDAYLKHIWAFDRLQVTDEDRQRNAFYQGAQERWKARERASTLAEFIASLKLQVRIAPVSPAQLARASQLTYRTNQMNLTTIRRTVRELEDLIAGGADCRVVEVWDRFGSYGLTGLAVLSHRADVLWVDTFLLSCRVLGRGVEHKVLSAVGEIAAGRNLRFVELPFAATARNLPARDFVASLPAEMRLLPDGSTVYRLTAAAAKAVAYSPETAPIERVPPPGSAARNRAPIPYVRIATELRTVRQIVARTKADVTAHSGELDSAATILEQQVAALWAELLGRSAIDLHENFFQLGGHSLLAVQLLSRARKAFGVELSLQHVYEPDFTASEMAKLIELEQAQQLGEDEYDALLEEIGRMSDEEVRSLLADSDKRR